MTANRSRFDNLATLSVGRRSQPNGRTPANRRCRGTFGLETTALVWSVARERSPGGPLPRVLTSVAAIIAIWMLQGALRASPSARGLTFLGVTIAGAASL
jgi:hypothetical protein